MIALLQFSVGNFRSIYGKKTISFQPSSIKDEPRSNVVVKDRVKYVRTSAVYGANSSGKSNLMLAMLNMGDMVFESIRLNDGDELQHEPFALAQKSEDEPTHYEVVFLVDDRRYRYGFEFVAERITSEWLFRSSSVSSREKPLFVRNVDGIGIDEDEFAEGIGLEGKTNDNRLFVSLVAQLGGEDTISKEVMRFFRGFNVISGLNDSGYRNITKKMFLDGVDETEKLTTLFKDLQLGFDDVVFRNEQDVNNREVTTIYTKHKVYSRNGKVKGNRFFHLENMESAGTQKLFMLAGPIVDTLTLGKILVVDELDAKMHPLISQYLVGLFNNPEKNRNNAQLIFTTHDTHLLSSSILRRDQIWFTEKNEKEETDIYSMMDILLPDGAKPRSDSNLEKNYILGRYGAIPYIMND